MGPVPNFSLIDRNLVLFGSHHGTREAGADIGIAMTARLVDADEW